MKISEQWLREWVKTDLPLNVLAERMTMAGLEVEGIEPVADAFTGVVVGHVLTKEKHPDADKLSCCTVDVGGSTPLSIVCGAKNVAANMKVPVATVGAVLKNNFKISKSKLRGAVSEGMICSTTELGLSESSDGIMILPDDAPVGQDIREYLELDDHILELKITPNRGDCLSVLGLARDLAVLTSTPLNDIVVTPVKATVGDQFPIEILATADCPHYVGRMIKNIDVSKPSPRWLIEKLRRSGVRSVDAVVDVGNYVMIELGQPMHIFDLEKLSKKIMVRRAIKDEKIVLLNGEEKTLNPNTLVIADDQAALAIAGVMGGRNSAVSATTNDIFIESAYFAATTITGKSREYSVFTDGGYRFERGVDFNLQEKAIERATALLLEIVGGQAGPVVKPPPSAHLPSLPVITVTYKRLMNLLGLELSYAEVTKILNALNFKVDATGDAWQVVPPSYRYDIRIEEDVIEEVARVFGYDAIKPVMPNMPLSLHQSQVGCSSQKMIKNTLAANGYSEVITYSFIDQNLQEQFGFKDEALLLSNPISAEMGVMRVSLWPGLIQTLQYNLHRNQVRARYFEVGMCFAKQASGLVQENYLSGLLYGSQHPEQWAEKTRKVDFYDLKADIERLCQRLKLAVEFKAQEVPGLHPGQSAAIFQGEVQIGCLGLLHPKIAQSLKLSGVYLFSLNLDVIRKASKVSFAAISKFPAVSRDVAILVRSECQAGDIERAIQAVAGKYLKELFVFDVYQGQGVPEHQKSLALRLVWQSLDETLQEQQITDLMAKVITCLTEKFAAKLRD